jgi:uncharacterized repeat protein (TIGR02543 family)
MNTGSKISGNTSSSGGGGVYVYYGTFTMSGGEISGNTSSSGGGVYVYYSTFTMSGGEISSNTSSSYGGGVYISNGTFAKQSGGIIYGSNESSSLKNTATSGDSYGHAVYVNSSPTKIRNTTAGYGVTLDSSISGAAGGWEYKITFDADGGNPTTQTRTAVSGGTVGSSNMPTVPNRYGYDFGGWHTAQNGGGTEFTGATTVSADITVYAQWTVTETFDADGGSPATQTQTVVSGGTVGSSNMPTVPSKYGYTFGGWHTARNGGGTEFTASTTVSAHSTVYARWTNVSVNVSVWVNEGDGTILSSNNDVTISKTGYLTSFTATVTGGYAGVQWYFDGFAIYGSRGTAQSISINAADYVAGNYILGVTVTKNGAPYSTDLRFTVTN